MERKPVRMMVAVVSEPASLMESKSQRSGQRLSRGNGLQLEKRLVGDFVLRQAVVLEGNDHVVTVDFLVAEPAADDFLSNSATSVS